VATESSYTESKRYPDGTLHKAMQTLNRTCVYLRAGSSGYARNGNQETKHSDMTRPRYKALPVQWPHMSTEWRGLYNFETT